MSLKKVIIKIAVSILTICLVIGLCGCSKKKGPHFQKANITSKNQSSSISENILESDAEEITESRKLTVKEIIPPANVEEFESYMQKGGYSVSIPEAYEILALDMSVSEAKKGNIAIQYFQTNDKSLISRTYEGVWKGHSAAYSCGNSGDIKEWKETGKNCKSIETEDMFFCIQKKGNTVISASSPVEQKAELLKELSVLI